VFQQEYAAALRLADRVLLADVHRKEQLTATERLSPEHLVHTLRDAGTPAWFYPETDMIIAHLCREAQPTDVVLVMSNGGFENIHQRLLDSLATRTPAPGLAVTSAIMHHHAR
jgi:UDP-N-acetylmuramate: L-alanyl-gamma-D-glutamyl-meso-diaminopimelate ligase